MNRREFIKKVGSLVLNVSLSDILSLGGNKLCHKNNKHGKKNNKHGKKNNKPCNINYETQVYISKANSYEDFTFLKKTIGKMVETIYNKKPFFQYGDTISIKPNLVSTAECLGYDSSSTYTSHPMVVKALGEVLKDLGAGKLYIAEGSTSPSNTIQAFSELGYDDIALYLGAELIDLNSPYPYNSFREISIDGGLAYNSIKVNEHLVETDCFISLAKLKCHSVAGITLSLKNLIGLLPMQEYSNGLESRVAYVHGREPIPITRVLYNIIDLARLFPSDFALVDGISSIDKGEGPWAEDIALVKPGLLIAGNNPVGVDSVCASIMGFDPNSDYPDPPFVNCHNYLKLAAQYGVGTNNLDEIEVLGESIDDVKYPYTPPRSLLDIIQQQ